MFAEGAAPFVGFLAVYLVALLGVGAYKATHIKSQEDFSLAGRGLPTFVLVGTLLATWIGTGSIFGNTEETLRVGLGGFILPVAGAAGILALWAMAARIRRFGQFTIQDILEARFGVVARNLGTITLLCAYVIIVSYQYRAGAAVLERLVPDMSHTTAVCCVATFVILYTALAGMFSVAYTDVANGVLMVLGIGLALPILYSKAGGFGGALEALPPPNRELFGNYNVAQVISVLLPSFLLLMGDANMYQRFFSARDPAAARRSAAWMFGGVLMLEWAIVAVALLGAGLIAQGQVAAPENPGHIVVHLAFETLPVWLGAMLVATVVAVIVSTADSYLLSPASSLVRDVYQRFVSPHASGRSVVLVSRSLVVVLGLIALGLSFTSDSFFHLALFAYTIYGAGITPALLAAFFWRRATRAGAVASILTGVLSACSWKAITTESVYASLADAGWERLAGFGAWGAERGWDAVIPAAVLNVLVLVVVSLLTAPPSEESARAI